MQPEEEIGLYSGQTVALFSFIFTFVVCKKMKAQTSSGTIADYHAILPKLDKKRDPVQDIAKGIGMLFVIFLHTTTLYTVGGRDTVPSGLFTILFLALMGYMMPFFFMISGYNYKPGTLSYRDSVRKRAKQLLVPLFNYTIVIWIILGAYLCLRGETDPWTLFKSYIAYWLTDPLAGWVGLDASRTLVAQAVGPTWFIKCLMVAYLIFAAVAPAAVQKRGTMFSAIVGLIFLSYIITVFVDNLPWDAEIAPAAAALMLIGFLMRKHDLFGERHSNRKWNTINALVALALLTYLQVKVPGVGMISGGRINFQMGAVEVFITLICGVLGTVFLMNVSKILVKVKGLNDFLAYVGQNSLTVLILHGAVMRIYSDIFGLTGTPAGSFGLTNLYVFLLTLLTSVLLIYLKGLINVKIRL